MGSIGLAIAWLPFIVVIGATLTVLALVFGGIGLRRSRASGVGRGASIAGIVMGGLGVAASVVGVVLSVLVVQEVLRFAEPGEVSTDVTACELDGRRAQVDGTVTNLDDEPHEYTLFVELGDRTDVVIVDELEPGETTTWSTTFTTRTDAPDCDPNIVVQGPFPYGIEVDPVD
jgi:predicted metalloprotease